MPILPTSLYTSEQTRAIDRVIIEHIGISAETLIARAGKAALDLIKSKWPDASDLLILCGTGNNAGDGFQLAIQAHNAGYKVSVIQIASDEALSSMSPETRSARSAYLQTGNTLLTQLPDQLPSSHLIVDGLFGTGLNREITGNYKHLIEKTQALESPPILSLDIPSGLHADSGKIMGTAIKANLTLSFIGLNIGLFTGQGPDYVGDIAFDSLGAPSEAYQQITAAAQRITLDQQQHLLAPRPRTAHKGNHGRLLVVGGNIGLSGAARMAAEAGARVGAGLISIATHPEHAAFLNINRPELMSRGVTQADELTVLTKQATVVVLGPGLGQDPWARLLFDQIHRIDCPVIIDADALNLLSKKPIKRDNWVLTPHPGEAARLLGVSNAQIQADRMSAVKAIQQRYGGVVILKGAGTLIYDGNSHCSLSTYGNPGMGSGGMGDVLSGVIGGLVAQGFSLIDAAQTGVILHGIAADRAAAQDGERGLLAMDLLPHLRHLVNQH